MKKPKATEILQKPITHLVSADEIRQAAKSLNLSIVATPMISAPSPSKLLGWWVHLKLQDLQYSFSFEARGATVGITHLIDMQKERGFIAM